MRNGRPPKWETPEELQEKVEAYLATTGWKTRMVVNKKGDAIEVEYYEPATVTGLAVALDTTRQTLLEYEGEVDGRDNKDPQFADIIKKAKAICIRDLEYGGLMGQLNPAMSIFSLKNNDEWSDRQKTDVTSNGETIGNINVTFQDFSDESETE